MSQSHRGLQASTLHNDVGGRCPQLRTPAGQQLLGNNHQGRLVTHSLLPGLKEGKPETASASYIYRHFKLKLPSKDKNVLGPMSGLKILLALGSCRNSENHLAGNT